MDLHNLVYKILNYFPILDSRIFYIRKLPYRCNLLDVGCGKGDVLKRFTSIRPDIEIVALDKENFRSLIPSNIAFYELDAEKDRLPFPDNFFDGATIIHVIEHIKNPALVLKEVIRVLKSGEEFYIETPHIKSLSFPSFNLLVYKGGGTLNFYDDPTHIRPYDKKSLEEILNYFPIENLKFGIYRNYIYTLVSPLLIILGFILLKRRWIVIGMHNLFGWSIYCTGRKKITSDDSNR